jgi:hypothetical protein
MIQITNSTGTNAQQILASAQNGNGLIVDNIICTSPAALPSSLGVSITEKNPAGTITGVELYNSVSSGTGSAPVSQVWNLIQGATVTGQVVPPVTGWPTSTLGNTVLKMGAGFSLWIATTTATASGTLTCTATGNQY